MRDTLGEARSCIPRHGRASVARPSITYRGVRGVMVIVVGNGHADSSSNPGRD